MAGISITVGILLALSSVRTCTAIEGRLQTRNFRPTRLNALKGPYDGSTDIFQQEIAWYNQTLDHFTPLDSRKFPQRYFESLAHWTDPDGPIFLIVCGEYVCGGVGSDYRLALAEKFGAGMVALEHRFYGESQPFQELTTENLSYLSSGQALEDLATFRQFYQADLNTRFHRPPGSDNPWVIIGISYPGALSAWFRLKFPHLVRGSLASSAVVQAVEEYDDFDKQVGRSAGDECAAALREVTAIVDAELMRNKTAIKELFGAEKLVVDGDFLFLLADAAAFAFQYGHPDSLCLPLVAASKGGDVLRAYVDYVQTFFYGHFGSLASDYDQSALLDTSSTGPNAVMRAWWFQCCTEVGYLQTAPAQDPVRSAGVNLEYYRSLCANVFGPKYYPDTRATNGHYGGHRIAGTRIYFANGSQDPWRLASKNSSTATEPSRVLTCHNCGHGTEFRGCPQWPSTPYGDASLCSNPSVVYEVREEMESYLSAWIVEDIDYPSALQPIATQ